MFRIERRAPATAIGSIIRDIVEALLIRIATRRTGLADPLAEIPEQPGATIAKRAEVTVVAWSEHRTAVPSAIAKAAIEIEAISEIGKAQVIEVARAIALVQLIEAIAVAQGRVTVALTAETASAIAAFPVAVDAQVVLVRLVEAPVALMEAVPKPAAVVAHPAWGAHAAEAVVAGDGAVVAAADGGGKQKMNISTHMRFSIFKAPLVILALAMFGGTLVSPALSQTAATEQQAGTSSARAFNTPKEAASALIEATKAYNVSDLLQILGPDGKDFISSADPTRDKNIAEEFAQKAQEKEVVTVDPNNKARATLSVGNDNWPFPIPIVQKGSKWYFDSKAGRTEILYRRIGSNELDAIQVCRGFVEAQKEYASEIHDNSGVNQYAQKIISTPGKQDGLYWQNADGTPGGPISEAIARAIAEGYSPDQPSPYHGYYFKVLKGQGPAARLGQLDYVIEGVMIGGFALVAVPADYRVTGVKTFIVSYDGIVYQKDLGPDSLKIVKEMERYNPDATWHRTNDEWPANTIATGD